MPIAFGGDTDGDGIKDDDFEEAALNVNLVLRWEPILGRTLYGVFTRSENGSPDLLGTLPRFRISSLRKGPTDDIFLLKFVYYIS